MALSKHGKESPLQYVIAIDWNWLFGDKNDFSLQIKLRIPVLNLCQFLLGHEILIRFSLCIKLLCVTVLR